MSRVTSRDGTSIAFSRVGNGPALILVDAASAARAPDIRVPTLVIDSDQSDERLHRWAQELASALPNARHRRLQGAWHGVAAEVLAPVVAEFFTGRSAGAQRAFHASRP